VRAAHVLRRKARCIIDGALIYRRDKDLRARACNLRLADDRPSGDRYRLPVCGAARPAESPLTAAAECRYARVDKAAPADYTITPCRETEPGGAQSRRGKHRASFYEAAVRHSLARTYISHGFGRPAGLRYFRYFRSSAARARARAVRVIGHFFALLLSSLSFSLSFFFLSSPFFPSPFSSFLFVSSLRAGPRLPAAA